MVRFISLPCRGPVWHGQDWSTCYRQEVLGKTIPFVVLVTSFLVLILQRMSSKRRKAASAQRIAQLDPASSHIQVTSQTSTSRLERALTTVMPLNGPRIAATLQGRPKAARRQSINSNGRGRSLSTASVRESSSSAAAALAIFHTENAVILNEVNKIMKERYYNPLDPDSMASQVSGRFSSRSIERMKRVWELVGSTLSASACAAAVAQGQEQEVWLAVWVSNLMVYECRSGH